MRYCLAPHCPEVLEGRDAYCASHVPQRAAFLGKGSANGWQRGRITKRVLRRDGYRCQIPGCTEPGVQADHIIPRAAGGTDDLTNMRALCFPHHAEKSERERLAG